MAYTIKSRKDHTKSVRADIGLDSMRVKKTKPTVCGRHSARHLGPVWVPIISSTGTTLMLCHSAYARDLIKSGRAKKRYLKGIFCIGI